MKIAKRIDIVPRSQPDAEGAELSATLLVDTEKNTSGWIIHIKKGKNVFRAEASSSTVVALMMAEREFKAQSTGFYEVGER